MKKIFSILAVLFITTSVIAQSKNWALEYNNTTNEFNEVVGRSPYLINKLDINGKDGANHTVSIGFFFAKEYGVSIWLHNSSSFNGNLFWSQMTVRNDKTGEVFHPVPYLRDGKMSYYSKESMKQLVNILDQGYFTLSVKSNDDDTFRTYGNSVFKITTQTQGLMDAIRASHILD